MAAKGLNFNTQCPCGHEINGVLRKPGLASPQIHKLACKGCSSKFLVTSSRKAGGVNVSFEIQELSPICHDILEQDVERQTEAKRNESGRTP